MTRTAYMSQWREKNRREWLAYCLRWRQANRQRVQSRCRMFRLRDAMRRCVAAEAQTIPLTVDSLSRAARRVLGPFLCKEWADAVSSPTR